MQVDAKVYFEVHGKLTTTADNNLGEVRMAELPDRILITEAKCRVRTHHNALRFSTVSHQTVGLAQARPNKCRYMSREISVHELLENQDKKLFSNVQPIQDHSLKNILPKKKINRYDLRNKM